MQWNDGQPFTAKDVAFTFNLMKQFPPTDLYSLWTGAGLQSVTASGDKVTMKFSQSAQPYFFYFADEVGIVPQHIWSSGDAAANPATWADKAPVGTGPFMVNPCSANNIEYTANPKYWQPGKPYIQKVSYPAYLDNGPANLDLANGKAQWGSQFIPNIQNFYLAKSPNNQTWSPPVTNVTLYANNASSHPTGKLGVRQAIAYALDRAQVAKIGEGGQQPAANQTGIVTPTFNKYFDSARTDRVRVRDTERRQGEAGAEHGGVLLLEAAQPVGDHGDRLHRLGRIAGGDQAAARPDRHQPHRR